MHRPEPHEHTLPCAQCDALVSVYCELDDWLDGSITVACPTHRTTTSAP